MSRILALDVGDRTIGVALSDETCLLALPCKTILRQLEGHRRDIAAIRRLIVQHEVGTVVVGLPLTMAGERGPQAAKVEAFAAALERGISVPVLLQDERLTTFEAENIMITAEVPATDRKRSIDSVAASLILRAYLDRDARPARSSGNLS